MYEKERKYKVKERKYKVGDKVVLEIKSSPTMVVTEVCIGYVLRPIRCTWFVNGCCLHEFFPEEVLHLVKDK